MRHRVMLLVTLCAVACGCTSTRGVKTGARGTPRDGDPAFLVGATQNQREAFELTERGAQIEDESPVDACEYYQRALALDPDDVVATRLAHREDMRWATYRSLANVLSRLGRRDEALDVIGRILTRWPDSDGAVWVLIASVWERSNDRQRALEFYWRAVLEGRAIGHWDLRNEWIAAVIRLSMTNDDAVAHISMEMKEFGDWKAHYHLAHVLARVDNDCAAETTIPVLERAMEEYEKAVALWQRTAAPGENNVSSPPFSDEIAETAEYLAQERQRALK